LQDPPELLPAIVAKWEEGFAMVLCIKRSSEETAAMFFLRRVYDVLLFRVCIGMIDDPA